MPTSTYGPRERLHQFGEPRLSDVEALALVLQGGRSGARAETVAADLLARFGGLARLAVTESRELARTEGVGPSRAAAIVAAFGLARRLTEHRMRPGYRVRGAGDVARLVRDATRGARRESFFACLLDARHRLLALRTVSTGDLCGAPAHPREVFHPAIQDGAAAIVVAHNHPSGDAAPSSSDRGVTERLRAVGELVGIEVLDHVVVGDAEFYSFAEDATRPIPRVN